MQLLNVGFGNTVIVNRIVAVINTGSSPARKLKELAKTNGKLIDVTEGRRTRSILVMDSDPAVRANRLAQLGSVVGLLRRLGDFGRLPVPALKASDADAGATKT